MSHSKKVYPGKTQTRHQLSAAQSDLTRKSHKKNYAQHKARPLEPHQRRPFGSPAGCGFAS